MTIIIEDNVAIVDSKSKTSFKENMVSYGIILALVFLMYLGSKSFLIVVLMFGLIGLLFLANYIVDKLFSNFIEKRRWKIYIRLDSEKNIYLKKNWGLWKNKEYKIDRSHEPYLEYKGFWRYQYLTIKTKKYVKNPSSVKKYTLLPSANRGGYMYDEGEIMQLAKFLDVKGNWEY